MAGVAARLPPGTRVLDVGAGECRYRPLLAHCEYVAHDFCAYAGTAAGPLRESWNYGRIDLVSDVSAIPAPAGSFDAVLCTEVLEHVPEPIRVLAELARVLRMGGQLFLSAPLGAGLHQQPFHFYGGYTPHFYRRFLPACGFEIDLIAPNGGFYRHLLQELQRAAGLIQQQRRYSRLHPAYWLLRIGFRRLLPRWLAKLDDEQLIEEFTVGYHVEARKVRAAIQVSSFKFQVSSSLDLKLETRNSELETGKSGRP
ncbi:MAG: class I SAM-dependent methyltransferase [Planctomycetota bacterium]